MKKYLVLVFLFVTAASYSQEYVDDYSGTYEVFSKIEARRIDSLPPFIVKFENDTSQFKGTILISDSLIFFFGKEMKVLNSVSVVLIEDPRIFSKNYSVIEDDNQEKSIGIGFNRKEKYFSINRHNIIYLAKKSTIQGPGE